MLGRILLSVFLVSGISLVGVIFLGLRKKILDRLLEVFVSFACGSLLGGAFIHLLPESINLLGENSFFLTLLSFLIFFILEKYLHWRHCHEGKCDVHAFTYLNLIGDALHNFIDGMVIAAAYLSSYHLGVVTTLAVALHEIPQEIGDFSILIYGGFKKKTALFFNFLSALTAVLGALVVYFFSSGGEQLTGLLLPFAAGGFIYTAAADLIPELHRKSRERESVSAFEQTFSLILGILLMIGLKTIFEV